MPDHKYHFIAGPDGTQDRYRFTVLDANVVKDVERLYRVRLRNIRDEKTLSRLRNFLRTLPRLGEVYAGIGALELTQPLTAAFDASKFSRYVTAVNNVANLTPAERLAIYKTGGPVSEVRCQSERGLEAGIGLIRVILPELLGSAAIFTKAWLLRASGIGWKSALTGFEEFCNTEIRYAPGIAVTIAISLIAGRGTDASELTAVLKNMDAEDPTNRAKSVMNAAADVQFLDSLRSIPTTRWVANHEDLSPTCGISADHGLTQLSRMLGYGSSPKHPSRKGSSIQLRQGHFPPDRLKAVVETVKQINAGVAARGNTPTQLMDDTRYRLFASSAFLDRHGSSKWVELASNLDADPESWWNVEQS